MSRALTICQFTCSTVGKKFLVAITGLLLSGFLLSHMAGNLLLFVSAEAYNKYSHALVSNPLIYLAEAGLLAFFLLHMGLAIWLCLENRAARDTRYLVSPQNKGTTFAAKSMIYTGLLVLAFLVLHLITFKFGAYYSVTYNGIEMRDIYRLVNEEFQKPLYTGWYLFSLVILGLHLSHGLSGAVQSLGLGSSLNCKLKRATMGIVVILILGFMSQPIFMMIKGVQ